MSAPATRATIDDLYRVEGKAELIGGRIVRYMATGRKPHKVGRRITSSLEQYEVSCGQGEGYGDGIGFRVPELSSGRESFSPDAAYFFGPFPANDMRFLDGPPTFAVQVRSENDYGESAETEMALKRDDYFEAGTRLVWDVDPIAETVACYRNATDPPTVWHRGDTANAEPALPGWTMAVNDIFG